MAPETVSMTHSVSQEKHGNCFQQYKQITSPLERMKMYLKMTFIKVFGVLIINNLDQV